MTTTKLYSNKTRFFSIYKSSLKHMLPFAIVVGIIFIIMIPLVFFVGVNMDEMYRGGESIDFVNRIRDIFSQGVYLDESQSGIVMVTLMVFALVCALVTNSYMHSKKTTDLYHSLPVKRIHLFSANMLATFTVIAGPFLVVYFVTMVSQLIFYGQALIGHGHYFKYILMDLTFNLISVLIVYLFTAFIAVNVGTVFDSFALTGVLGFLPITVVAIVSAIWEAQTYGGTSNYDYLVLLSPFTFMFSRYEYFSSYYGYMPEDVRKAIIVLVIWFVIGVALFFGSLACYNRRKSEIAELTQTKGLFQTIAKCFAAFCGGSLFFAIFYDFGNILLWCIAMLFGALLIGTIVELILSRGFRSLGKNLKWLAGAGALCCLVVIAVTLDLTGFDKRVPSPDNVASVSISYRGRFNTLSDMELKNRANNYGYQSELTNPESIAVVTDAHHLAVANQPPKDYDYGDYSGDSDMSYIYKGVDIEYKMKNGTTMRRSYNRMNMESVMKFADLEDKDDFIKQNHEIFYLNQPIEGSKVDPESQVRSITLYNTYGAGGTPYNLPLSDTKFLLEAVRKDMLAESLADIQRPSSSALGYLEIQYAINAGEDTYNSYQYGSYGNYSCVVIIGRNYTNTVAALTAMGLLGSMDYQLNVDQVYIVSANGALGETNGVVALRPASIPTSDYSTDYANGNGESISTSDPGEIQQVLASGRNQLLATGTYNEGDTAIAVYYAGGVQIGGQLIYISDLPQSVRSKAQKQFGVGDGSPTPGDAIVPDMVMADVANSDISVATAGAF